MIAAGENAKALQTYLGHSDRYGYPMLGAECESADRLSPYLGGQSGSLAQLANSI